jgi:hypothetical protein
MSRWSGWVAGLGFLHLLLSIGLALISLRLAAEVSNERDLNPAGPSDVKVAAADASAWLADGLMRPLAYCDPGRGGCDWVSHWLPGAWSLMLFPLNSLAWGVGAVGVAAFVRWLRSRIRRTSVA